MAVESPPLWAWPVVAGVTIATKFIYRWHATKQLSKHNYLLTALIKICGQM